MAKLQPVRGTKDLYGEKQVLFDAVVTQATNVAENFCFEHFSTPIFEFTEVFSRSLGETSDVVSKEMYSFSAKGEESITLRPEFTAPICRAFISNGLEQHLPLRLFSHGPVFRYERPQECRQRQFHQLNFEVLGNSDFMQDVELILLANQLLKKLGIAEKVKLNINSLGCTKTRLNFRTALVEYLADYVADLSEDSKNRLHKNPLRILDSKDPKDQHILANAPKLSDYFSLEAGQYFENVINLLNEYKVNYEINHKLVRGLDYYTHTIFEYITDQLGAQGTVLAGGRYDNLIKNLGGKDIQGVGFAAGIERIMALIEEKPQERKIIAVIPITQNEYLHAFSLTNILREYGFKVSFDLDANLKKRMQKAAKLGVKAALFIGAEEVINNLVKIKDFDTGQETVIETSELIDRLNDIMMF